MARVYRHESPSPGAMKNMALTMVYIYIYGIYIYGIYLYKGNVMIDQWFFWGYPLVNIQKAIENMAIEIVDFPS